MSLFLPTVAELERVAERFPACRGLLAEERALRDALPLMPRCWIKLSFDGEALEGTSQYFQIQDTVGYPIASLRWFARRYGAEGADRLETALRPELERAGTVWGLVLRHGHGAPRPRLAVRVPPAAVPLLLERLATAEFVTRDAAARLAGIRLANDHPRYVSWTPGDPGACALDFEAVEPHALPHLPALPAGRRWRYAKARPEPAGIRWTGYIGYRDLHPGMRSMTRRDYVREVRAYYDDTLTLVRDTFGATYQAGWLGRADAAASNRRLAQRAGLAAGQHVLDVGCGLGGPAADILAAIPGLRITGITISPAQARAAGAVCGDFHDLPFAPASFDVAMYLESATYAHDLACAFAEARRALVPGGRLYVKDHVRLPGVGTDTDLREFERTFRCITRTPAEFAEAAKAAGFSDIALTDLGQDVSMDHWRRAMLSAEGTLTPFGERHYRMYGALGLGWAELTARR